MKPTSEGEDTYMTCSYQGGLTDGIYVLPYVCADGVAAEPAAVYTDRLVVESDAHREGAGEGRVQPCTGQSSPQLHPTFRLPLGPGIEEAFCPYGKGSHDAPRASLIISPEA